MADKDSKGKFSGEGIPPARGIMPTRQDHQDWVLTRDCSIFVELLQRARSAIASQFVEVMGKVDSLGEVGSIRYPATSGLAYINIVARIHGCVEEAERSIKNSLSCAEQAYIGQVRSCPRGWIGPRVTAWRYIG